MKNFRKILLWTLVGLLSLGQLQRIELQQFNSSISFYLHDIFIIFFIFHIVFTDFTAFKNSIIDYLKKEKKIQFFIGLITFSLIINILNTGDYISLLYFSRLACYIIFGFSLLLLIKNNKYDAEYLKFQIVSVGIISLFLGFLQYIFIKDTRFLSIFGWDDHYARLIGTYFDPGFTGIIFLLTLLIGLSSKYLQNAIVKIIFSLLFVWGIVLTFSRASYLALIVSFLILVLLNIKINKIPVKKLLIGLAFIIILIILAPKPYGEGVNLLRISTINARTTAFTQQLSKLTPQTILIGNGPFSEKNSLGYQKNKNNEIIPSHSRIPDNIFVTVLLSTGIFGLLSFIALLFDWTKQLKNKNIYLFAGFVSLLVHAQFSNSLLQPFVLLILLGGIVTVQQKPYKLNE